MKEKGKEQLNIRLLRLALERLRLGELSKLEQEEWDRWEAMDQVEDGATCH